MPPGQLYNWLTVAHSVADILEHATQYRGAQLTRNGAAVGGRKRRKVGDDDAVVVDEEEASAVAETADASQDGRTSLKRPPTFVRPSSLHRANEEWMQQVSIKPTVRLPRITTASPSQTLPHATEKSTNAGLGAYLSETVSLPPNAPRPYDADAAASPSPPRPSDIPWEPRAGHSQKAYDAKHEVSLSRSSVPPAQVHVYRTWLYEYRTDSMLRRGPIPPLVRPRAFRCPRSLLWSRLLQVAPSPRRVTALRTFRRTAQRPMSRTNPPRM
ncbi:hypothetical protein DENSPDRAFT_68035 [Dentipellis sp. KUC8613]|nr:hypothetical protein DENSPDRAFT_68035 [Dentipellis sp. KUC8613]